jgi:hypothetical protein
VTGAHPGATRRFEKKAVIVDIENNAAKRGYLG